MKVFDLNRIIEDIARGWSGVNYIIPNGDIFRLNNEQNITYAAVGQMLQNTIVNKDEEYREYNYTMWFADILLDDKSNEEMIKTQANDFFEYLMKSLEEFGCEIVNSNITYFTQRFLSLCAGGILNLTVRMDYVEGCEDKYSFFDEFATKSDVVEIVDDMTDDLTTADEVVTIVNEMLDGNYYEKKDGIYLDERFEYDYRFPEWVITADDYYNPSKYRARYTGMGDVITEKLDVRTGEWYKVFECSSAGLYSFNRDGSYKRAVSVSNIVKSDEAQDIKILTQQQYDALTVKDNNTIYMIKE